MPLQSCTLQMENERYNYTINGYREGIRSADSTCGFSVSVCVLCVYVEYAMCVRGLCGMGVLCYMCVSVVYVWCMFCIYDVFLGNEYVCAVVCVWSVCACELYLWCVLCVWCWCVCLWCKCIVCIVYVCFVCVCMWYPAGSRDGELRVFVLRVSLH